MPPSQAPTSTPKPDPTILTTQQLDKGLAGLREVLEARMDGTDKIINRLESHIDTGQTAIDAKVSQLQELHGEKFRSIAVQFSERDIRTEQTARDSKVAVDAALQAAKEAVGEQNKSSALAIAKSEAATTKQIDQIIALITATNSGLNDKIDDIKTRILGIEGRSSGLNAGWGYIVGGIGVLLGIAAIVSWISKMGGG